MMKFPFNLSTLLTCGLFSFCILLADTPFAMSQEQQPQSELNAPKDAVEITADVAIEWVRDENMYRARGNVMAKQGNVSVNANALSAFYDPQDTRTITEIHADERVVIESDDQKITGEKGIYNLQTRLATVTGRNLSVKTPEASVTANKSLTYDQNQQKATAKGNATASDGINTIYAETLTAWLAQSQGKNSLKKVTASGGIRINTPTETITGQSGVYDAIAQTATIEGGVKIVRGENQLNGARALINLKTGVSQLLSSPVVTTDGQPQQGTGRVRALFYPDSNAKP